MIQVGASWCTYYVTGTPGSTTAAVLRLCQRSCSRLTSHLLIGANTFNFMTVYYVKPWARYIRIPPTVC